LIEIGKLWPVLGEHLMKTKIVLPLALMLVGAGVLSSCATLDQAECQTVNWADLGQRDGQQGRAFSYISEHQSACAKHGLPVDEQSWRGGWEQGIRQYCVPENGISVGLAGNFYGQSCPADMAPDFQRAYGAGKSVYDARISRDRVRGESDELARKIAAATTPEERSVLQTQLILKQSDLLRAESRLRDSERDLDRYRYGVRTGF
jgi:hypothetical protein